MNANSKRRLTGRKAAGVASQVIVIAIVLLLCLGVMLGCSSKTCDDCGKTFSGQAYFQSYVSNPNYNPYREDGGELYEGVGTICEECAQDRWGDGYQDRKVK